MHMYVSKMYICIYICKCLGIRNLCPTRKYIFLVGQRFLTPKHFHILASGLNFSFINFMNSMFYNHRYEILIDVSYISSRAY